MKEHMRRMIRKALNVLAFLFLLPFIYLAGLLLCCGMLSLPDIFIHNQRLASYVVAFQKMEHPLGTSELSFRSMVTLVGNGNHCDYFVGEMRQFTGERQAIIDFYEGQEVHGQPVFVAFVENGEFPHETSLRYLPQGLDNPKNWLDSPFGSLENVYVVYVFDIGNDAGLDFRCH
jgi:hypothetical protein